jgi:hypothetical protein
VSRRSDGGRRARANHHRIDAPLRALLALAVACAGAASLAPAARAQQLAAALEEQKASDKEAIASQARIDVLDDETEQMLVSYQQLMSETESFEEYSDQLAAQVQSQIEEIDRTNRELDEIEVTTREVMPMMQRMIDTLDRFVGLDVPFLMEERTRRVQGLKDLMSRADVSVSEKYRRIVEAYLVEMEYGRTIEAYDGKLGEESERTVQLLRIGRVSLMYQTLDGKETGYWDDDQKTWVEDDHYAHAFSEGVRVAKKLGAPDILRGPVQAPKEDRQ